MDKLTPKQQAFVDYYLATSNATEAARRAGYKGNTVTLGAVGAENLKKPQIVSQLTKRGQEVIRKREKRIINTYEEFTKNLDFVSKLRDAAERWLIDPNDSDRFSIDPRSDEIDVVYLDYEDKDAQGNPKRKTECLQELLARLQGTRYSSDTQFVKTADIREFALKAVDRIDTTIDKFAKLGGEYTKDKDNPQAAEMAAKHYAQALDFAVRFALAPGEKTHATALAMLAENAKGNADLEAVVAELAEKMNVKQISAKTQ